MAEVPLGKLQEFVKDQKEWQDRNDAAVAAFAKRLPELLPPIKELTDAFSKALEVGSHNPTDVQASVNENTGTLMVAFGMRAYGHPAIFKEPLRPGERVTAEIGARVVFRCDEEEGVVHGHRSSFFKEGTTPSQERFAGDFDPETVDANKICLAVVDFLQWASTGKGRGSRNLRFR
jgi:hypothetical protein